MAYTSNEATGQTIPHVHIHLIPRYEGDIAEPGGGGRGVIPEKIIQVDVVKLLAEFFVLST
ncbi:MAG: HIT family protein [Bacteroidales bacterium]